MACGCSVVLLDVCSFHGFRSFLFSSLYCRVGGDAESTSENTFIKSEGEAGHVHIEGTLEDVFKMEDIAYEAFCAAAKTATIGKNNSLFGLWLVHNASIAIPTGEGQIEALHAMIRVDDVEDKDKYRLAFGGSGGNVLFFQAPSLEHSDIADLFEYLGDVEAQSGVESENRSTAYMKEASALQAAASHVYAFKVPYSVRNDYFQDDIEPDTTLFTGYKTFIEYDHGADDEWSRKGVRVRIGWEIPLVCEIESTNLYQKKEDSDAAKHKAREAKRKAAVEKVKGKYNSPMRTKAKEDETETGTMDD